MRCVVLGLFLLGVCAPCASAAAGVGRPTFYLAEVPGQCVIAPHTGKTVSVVPCSDPRHNLEVYAVGHGGWDHRSPPAPSVQYSIARSICLAAFQRITGHPMSAAQGWYANWPDPGAEEARYGDKVICSFGHHPGLAPLGSGRHIR
jgi:hypothetical protein